jgi:hypothetical protein
VVENKLAQDAFNMYSEIRLLANEALLQWTANNLDARRGIRIAYKRRQREPDQLPVQQSTTKV